MNEPKIGKLFFCECHAAGVLLHHWPEDREVGVCIWGYRSRELDWFGRLRYCWRILWTGRPYGDDTLLDYVTAREMAQDILKMTEEGKP